MIDFKQLFIKNKTDEPEMISGAGFIQGTSVTYCREVGHTSKEGKYKHLIN